MQLILITRVLKIDVEIVVWNINFLLDFNLYEELDNMLIEL